MKRYAPGIGASPSNPLGLFITESLTIRKSIEDEARRLGYKRGTPEYDRFLERQGCPQELTLKTLMVDIPDLVKSLKGE